VPSQYATIQAAIDASVDWDEVVIADGTYTGAGNWSLHFDGKRIRMRSASGDPALCVIDAEHASRTLYFNTTAEDPNSIIEGLTFTRGMVQLRNSSPTFKNCVMTATSAYRGPGVHLRQGSDATFKGCIIEGNTADWEGGGIYCSESSPTLEKCTISGNSATAFGGGISCYDYSSPILTECKIVGNTAGSSGGGVFCSRYSSPTFEYCTIGGNSATYSEGGVTCVDHSSPTFIGCRIEGNVAGSDAGGIGCITSSEPTLTNCILSRNRAGQNGGAIYCSQVDLTITNCTICFNTAVDHGGGAYLSDSHPTIKNSIVWGNSPDQFSLHTGSDLLVEYCDVQGGWVGHGNIPHDPQFRDTDGPDNDPNTWEDNDHRLMAGSACIDEGNNGDVPGGVLHDMDGLPRVVNGDGDMTTIVDMGASERPAELAGDLNCDGEVDFYDINPFVCKLSHPDRYAVKYAGCIEENADVNGDGAVDFHDINPFVTLLVQD
jgi:parallel beta-helix repeat protein/predicted outer membrane repeat protein